MNQRAGFTLVEVLVAVAVTAILVVGISGVTASIVATAKGQEKDAKRNGQTLKAIALLREDWRGRTRLIDTVQSRRARPADGSLIAFTTTADSLTASDVKRGIPVLYYAASPAGLVRKEIRSEGEVAITLHEEPVLLEYWNGRSWNPDPEGYISALRLTFVATGDRTVIR